MTAARSRTCGERFQDPISRYKKILDSSSVSGMVLASSRNSSNEDLLMCGDGRDARRGVDINVHGVADVEEERARILEAPLNVRHGELR
jgi:hypothetical protein